MNVCVFSGMIKKVKIAGFDNKGRGGQATDTQRGYNGALNLLSA